MIEINKLTEKDIGKWVIYRNYNKEEVGRIKSWNKKYIFVVYKCNYDWENFKNYTGNSTSPEDLEFASKCPVCKQSSLCVSSGYHDGQQQISPDVYYCMNCEFIWEQDCRPEYSMTMKARTYCTSCGHKKNDCICEHNNEFE